ncbi:ciliary microtubule associated protein 1A-like isoform X2 [Mytilus trossulus]|uniref:ciliary microtubule associated protein 1A-like isoform X2 n=1 Tax=Mytilus trossulus TaxID=6551 RepID=UPI003003E75A
MPRQRFFKMEPLVQKPTKCPGPAKYLLPNTVGTKEVDVTKKGSPSFTFGSRYFSNEFKRMVDKSFSPGPAYNVDSSFTSKGRGGGPSYSFGGRIKEPTRWVSPGPGAYSTDRKPLREINAPAYSLSPRTTQRRIDYTPSPNAYSLPSTIGPNVPGQRGGYASSIQGKSSYMNFNADLAKSPGPASYFPNNQNGNKKNPPSFSISGRGKPEKYDNSVPGPGAYSPSMVNMTSSPRYPIGVRHSQFQMPVMPLANVSD